jgi:hypothetical protein
LVIEGEIGIGKTALWKHGLSAAANRSHRVLACRPIDAEAQLAYAALGDLLAEVPEGALAELPGPQRHALEVALLRAEPEEQRSLPRAVAFATQEPESTFCWTTSFSPPLCAQPVPRWPRSPGRAVSSMTRGLHSSKATAPAGTSGQPITAPPP